MNENGSDLNRYGSDLKEGGSDLNEDGSDLNDGSDLKERCSDKGGVWNDVNCDTIVAQSPNNNTGIVPPGAP